MPNIPVTATLLATLCRTARHAGQAILEVYHQGSGAVWHKEDASPLTEADLRADAVIRQALEANFPGVFILSEESRTEGDSSALACQTFFLVDPLDGTKEFMKRSGEFTVNIALVQQGAAVAGVVYAPVSGELFYAGQGLGAWKQQGNGGTAQALQTAAWAPPKPLRVLGSRSHGDGQLGAWLAQLTNEHCLVRAGSSLKFCRIAEGLADLYPRFGPTSQWDTAAAQCVLEAAGGAVLDGDGQPLIYGLQRPLLNPEFAAVGSPALAAFWRQFCPLPAASCPGAA